MRAPTLLTSGNKNRKLHQKAIFAQTCQCERFRSRIYQQQEARLADTVYHFAHSTVFCERQRVFRSQNMETH